MLLDYEPNRKDPDIFLDEVLNFCLKTDVCKMLNMSFWEIYTTFDLPTYVRVKDAVNKELDQKQKIVQDTQKQMETRQRQLLGDLPRVDRTQPRYRNG